VLAPVQIVLDVESELDLAEPPVAASVPQHIQDHSYMVRLNTQRRMYLPFAEILEEQTRAIDAATLGTKEELGGLWDAHGRANQSSGEISSIKRVDTELAPTITQLA